MNAAVRRCILALFVLAATASTAWAQTPPADNAGAPPAAAPAETPPPAPPPMMEPPPPPPPMAMPAAPVVTSTSTATSAAPPSAAPVKVESANASIKLGILAQAQYEALGSEALDGYTQNIFFRRFRILAGGSLFGMFDYFVETDFPNLMKQVNTAPAGMPAVLVKNTPGIAIQDAFVTYKPMADLIKLDVGYMLPPIAHNGVQSAASLYGFDYFANTFLSGNVFGTSANPVGRDMGFQLRGLLVGGKVEYRAGLFQGRRNGTTDATKVAGRNFFRFVARAQINFLDAETGFFYAGTYFGAKKILSIGGSADIQDDYKYFAGDLFVDMPAGPGVGTLQANYAHWDGGTFVALPKLNAIMAEGGYLVASMISPIVRFERLSGDAPTPVQTKLAVGVALWPWGHSSNLKAFYQRTKTENSMHAQNQFLLQWQLFLF